MSVIGEALRDEMESNLLNLIYEVERCIENGNFDKARYLLEDAFGLVHEFSLYEYEANLCKLEETINEMEE